MVVWWISEDVFEIKFWKTIKVFDRKCKGYDMNTGGTENEK